MKFKPTAQELAEWKREGRTDPWIGAFTGVTARTVAAWRKRAGVMPDGSVVAPTVYICSNPHCRREQTLWLVNGFCMACQAFWWLHRRLRTQEDMRRIGETCYRCHEQHAVSRGLCNACSLYFKNNGRNRPRHLWNRTACTNCGKPHRPREFAYGRCGVCAGYFRRHGVERPERLWRKIAPLGWCDCSRPAVATVTVPVNSHYETYALCREHLEYEIECGYKEGRED